MHGISRWATVLGFVLLGRVAQAETSGTAAPPSGTAALPSYTVPFQLRGVIPRDALRLDSTWAKYARDATRGEVAVAMLSTQSRLNESLALQFRWGVVDNAVDARGESRMGVLNPTVGFLIGVSLSHYLRFAFAMAAGVPVGSGGGDRGDPLELRMQRQAALARSSMDNTSFTVNDVGVPTGLSLAYIAKGLTCQIDVTVTPSARVRGEHVQSDARKVNATSGLFVGQLVLSSLSLGFELRYQRFLSTPAAVALDPTTRDNLTGALGARLIVDLGGNVSARPALSYGRSVRGAGLQQAVQALQLDLPIVF